MCSTWGGSPCQIRFPPFSIMWKKGLLWRSCIFFFLMHLHRSHFSAQPNITEILLHLTILVYVLWNPEMTSFWLQMHQLPLWYCNCSKSGYKIIFLEKLIFFFNNYAQKQLNYFSKSQMQQCKAHMILGSCVAPSEFFGKNHVIVMSFAASQGSLEEDWKVEEGEKGVD